MDDFNVCIKHAIALVNEVGDGSTAIDDNRVWDRLTQISDIMRLSSYIDRIDRWRSEREEVIRFLFRYRSGYDLRKRGQVLKSLFALTNTKCQRLSRDLWMSASVRELYENRIRALAAKIHYWEKIDETRIYRFLQQADDPLVQRGLLDLLERFNFVRHSSIEQSLHKLMATNGLADANSALLAPLGSPSGSTGLVAYGIDHLSEFTLFNIEGNGLSQVPDTIRHIVIVDDCCFSGTQSCSVLKELFNEPRRGRFKHVGRPISQEGLDRLIGMRLTLLFYLGNSAASGRIAAYLDSKGFDAVIKWAIDEPYFSSEALNLHDLGRLLDENGDLLSPELAPYNSPFEPGAPFWSSDGIRRRTRAFLEEVGYALLSESGFTEKRRMQSSLGFSNAQKMWVFEHNVPKSTITAFWKRGFFGGRVWMPLFPERDRRLDVDL